jgi:hypothetical protein
MGSCGSSAAQARAARRICVVMKAYSPPVTCCPFRPHTTNWAGFVGGMKPIAESSRASPSSAAAQPVGAAEAGRARTGVGYRLLAPD